MAGGERSFSETEKVNLLAEIIKTSNVPHTALLRIIDDYRIDPQWHDVSRPPGRSIRDCQDAFHNLRAAAPMGMPSSVMAPRRDLPQTNFPPPPGIRTQMNPELVTSFGRTLQPRPLGLPLEPRSIPTASSSPTSVEPPPRKRGRPSNADAEARKQHYAALGQDVPRPRRPPRRSKGAKESNELGTALPSTLQPFENEAMISGGSTSQESLPRELPSSEMSSMRKHPPEYLRLPSMDIGPTTRPFDQPVTRAVHSGGTEHRSLQSRPMSSSNLALPQLLPASTSASEPVTTSSSRPSDH